MDMVLGILLVLSGLPAEYGSMIIGKENNSVTIIMAESIKTKLWQNFKWFWKYKIKIARMHSTQRQIKFLLLSENNCHLMLYTKLIDALL